MADRKDLIGLNLELDHKYAVESVVHRGPLATTYRATWTLFDLPVHVRFYESLVSLRLRHRDTTRIRWTLESEAGKVRGPTLPDTIDAGIHGPMQPFLVMRLPEGELLLERLQREGRLPASDVVRIVHAVAQALADCRAQADPHRGPTADRVWLGNDGEVILLGYGEVLYRDDTLTMGAVPTTELLWHIPPESFRASQSPAAPDESSARSTTLRMRARGVTAAADRSIEESPRAEVYALGCLAYYALQGHHPFFTNRSDPPDGIQATLVQDPAPLDVPVDDRIADAIERAISRDPDARFDTPQAFAAALGAAPRVTPASAPPDFDEDDDELERFEDVELAPSGRDSMQLWLWRIAAVVLAVALGVTLLVEGQRHTAVMITSTPSGLEIGRENGHVRERLGRTPVVLEDEPVEQSLRLFAIGPDGTEGPVAEIDASRAQLIGQCRRIDLDLQYTGGVGASEGSGTEL